MNVTALAVIVDSAVTLYVGWLLNRRAKRHVQAAAEQLAPAVKQAVHDVAKEMVRGN